MDHPNRDSLDISAQQLQTNVENTADKTKNSNSFERQAEEKNADTDRPVGDPEKNETNISQTNDDEPSEDHQYATPRELSLLSTVFTIATFMIAIDGSILATAIPTMTSDFHKLDDVSWYGSAYLLTEMAFQPTFGRLYSIFDAKILYLISILVFEVGSILCAAAPNSAAFIVGRVISGAGAAGLLCGSLAIYGRSVPLRARPFGMALVTSMYGIAGVLGPTVGGLITDTPRLTWRFCFWINLPLGAVTFAIAFKALKRKTPLYGKLSLRDKIQRIDLLGACLLAAGLVALFFALQWGGSRYKWSNPKVYGCLIAFGLVISAFVGLQTKKKEEATIPMRILSQRTVAISCAFNMLMSMANSTHTYYLAFYFQSVLGTSAVISGVRNLAYGIPCSFAILVTGACISSKGYYVPFMWLGTSVFIAGCVLLRTLDINSPAVKWASYQVVSGLGLGLAEQVPFIAVQVVLPDADMPTACALVVFSRCLGGAVGLSVASNLFSGELIRRLKQAQGAGLGQGLGQGLVDVSTIQDAGAKDLEGTVPPDALTFVRKAFGYAIAKAFIMPIAVAGISLLLSFGMQRKWIPDDRIRPTEGDDTALATSSDSGRDEKTVK